MLKIIMGKKFTCRECPNRTFRKSCSLRWHYKNYHPTLEHPTLKQLVNSKFICDTCNKRFNFHINLVKHIKRFHCIQVLPSTKNKIKCDHCNAEYISKKNLKRHEILKHNTSVALIPKKFKCVECGCEYTSNRNLKRHERLKHNSWVIKKLTTISCSLCSTSVTQKEDLYRHWKIDHAINIDTDEFEFENKYMFLEWKSSVESNTKTKFVRNISGFSSKCGETVYFQCNRSGYFTSRSKGIRQLKAHGTCKINSICPARMKVRVLENGRHIVQFTKTHVCQEHDLEHTTSKSHMQNQHGNVGVQNSFDVVFESSSKNLPSTPKKFKCMECSAEYTISKNLKRHARLKHGSSVEKKFTVIKCSLCTTFLTQKEDLYRHWKLEHAINLETEEFEFENKDLFFEWKSGVESNTKSRFIRNISGFSSKSCETVYFQCNRSGYFTSKSKGLRQLKTQGSCKINSICPARMKVRVLDNGKYMVQFIKTHVGHGHEFEQISADQIQQETFNKRILFDTSVDHKLEGLTLKKFKCMLCSAQYTSSKSLKRHESLKHSDTLVRNFNIIKCSLCSIFVTQKVDLFRHWELDHSINIETEELELKNKDMFLTWKSIVETDTKSKFVRYMSGFSSRSGETLYFQCNRSGYFTSKSKGFRHLKTQGSCKINSICPAGMKVRIQENGKHLVKFTKTHVGHDHDLGHLSLTQPQRETLARKIARNIPFDAILNGVRESIESDLAYGRIHLLTRKDLHNIKQSFSLFPNAETQHREEVVSDFQGAEKPKSQKAANKNEDAEVTFLFKPPLELATTEESSIEIMKKEVNDSYQTLSASASSHEDLVVIASLLENTEPLFSAIQLSNSETEQRFKEMAIKIEQHNENSV